jgi:hypothetical protein
VATHVHQALGLRCAMLNMLPAQQRGAHRARPNIDICAAAHTRDSCYISLPRDTVTLLCSNEHPLTAAMAGSLGTQTVAALSPYIAGTPHAWSDSQAQTLMHSQSSLAG